MQKCIKLNFKKNILFLSLQYNRYLVLIKKKNDAKEEKSTVRK